MMNSLHAIPKTTKHKRRYCRIEGCTKIVKSQGVCQRHGAKPRKCKIPGCVKQAQGNFHGMCKSHGRHKLAPTTQQQISAMKDTTTTTTTTTHDVYLMVNRPPKKQPSPPPCHGDASQLVRMRTLYSRPVSHQHPRSDPVRTLSEKITSSSSSSSCEPNHTEPSLSFKINNSTNRRICTVRGCAKVIKSQGVCQRHGAKPARCKIAGCAKQAQGGFAGMCKAHYQVLGIRYHSEDEEMPIYEHQQEEVASMGAKMMHPQTATEGELSPASVLDHSMDSAWNNRRQEVKVDSSASFYYPESDYGRPVNTSSTYAFQPRAGQSDIGLDTSLFFDTDDSNPFEPIAFNPAWSVPI